MVFFFNIALYTPLSIPVLEAKGRLTDLVWHWKVFRSVTFWFDLIAEATALYTNPTEISDRLG